MQSCLEINMGSWLALYTQKFITHYAIHHPVLATKQTLLSILLANHALLETYLQDEDSPDGHTIEPRGTTGECMTYSPKNKDYS